MHYLFSPSYGSSTSEGDRFYFDEPMSMGTNYDWQANRYYETFWIGAFDMDSYVYDLSVVAICSDDGKGIVSP